MKTVATENKLDLVLDKRNSGLLYMDPQMDITEKVRAANERRKLEAQVQHAQKLESLGVLAGGIAHDFNNILAIIIANIDMLELGDQRLGHESKEMLGQVMAASKRAKELVKQIERDIERAKDLLKPHLGAL